jgi:hypothetical protein
MRIASSLLCAVLVGAPPAAQVAASTGYRLDGWALDAGGEAACSTGFAAFGELDVLGDVGLASSGFRVDVGFLGVFDPGATQVPVVFGVEPAFGSMDVATPVVIAGLNFVKGGAAGAVSVSLGGVALGDAVVVSDTQLAATVPAGTSGPKDLVVVSQIGSTTAKDAFVHTPGLLLPDVLPLGGTVQMKNYGPVGALFDTWISPNATSIPFPPFGTIEIGPAPLVNLVSGGSYPAPDGVNVLSGPVADNPSLVGVSLHFQSIAVLSFTPLDVRLTNSRTAVHQ